MELTQDSQIALCKIGLGLKPRQGEQKNLYSYNMNIKLFLVARCILVFSFG
jgi:hypothetical protein